MAKRTNQLACGEPLGRARVILLAVFLGLVFVLTQAQPPRMPTDCFLGFNRQVGRLNRYNWVCVCPWATAPFFRGLGIVHVPAPSPGQDTEGRGRATARCAERAAPRLIDLCTLARGYRGGRQDPAVWEHEAGRVLRRCIAEEPLTQQERHLNRPFVRTYNAERCRATFVRVQASRRSGSWLCECVQDGQQGNYDVIPGLAEFITKGSPEASEEEWRSLDDCTRAAARQFGEVCQTSPGDYEILALHLLQACCKRARVAFDSKFECAVIVPDDLSAFKIANNDLQ